MSADVIEFPTLRVVADASDRPYVEREGIVLILPVVRIERDVADFRGRRRRAWHDLKERIARGEPLLYRCELP